MSEDVSSCVFIKAVQVQVRNSGSDWGLNAVTGCIKERSVPACLPVVSRTSTDLIH